MPPDAAATMGATMGRSHAAVMVEREVSWKYMLEVNCQLIGLGGRFWGSKRVGRNVHYEGEIETGEEG